MTSPPQTTSFLIVNVSASPSLRDATFIQGISHANNSITTNSIESIVEWIEGLVKAANELPHRSKPLIFERHGSFLDVYGAAGKMIASIEVRPLEGMLNKRFQVRHITISSSS